MHAGCLVQAEQGFYELQVEKIVAEGIQLGCLKLLAVTQNHRN